MVSWHKELFPTAEVFLSCKRKNYNVSTKGKVIHVVGSACVGPTPQGEIYHLEGIQEVF
jgi:hypothetical protein